VKGVYKVLFIGESGVGKTSLLKRATEGWFDAGMKLTVGVDFAVREVTYGDWRATLQIWDLGGQIRFRDLAIAYFKGARLAIAVFDISSRFTMDRLHEWIRHLYESEGEIPLVVVGNKIDLRDSLPPTHRSISPGEGRAFAETYRAPYIEASAKDGRGVEEIFIEVTKILAERYPQPQSPLDLISSTNEDYQQ